MPVFRDQLGRTITMDEPPRRIVSVVPSQTELLFDLGLNEEIVGVSKFCVHPGDKVAHKEKVGGTKNLNIPLIASLQPDLILAAKEENTKEQIKELGKRFPVWVSDISNLDSALEMIHTLGGILGKGRTTDILQARISGEFDKLAYKVEATAPLRVAYLIWRKPYMVAASGTFIDCMLNLAGFENAFGNKKRYPKVSAEDLAKANADLILLSDEPYPFDYKHFEEFRAICEGSKVYLVEGSKFSWYGSHLVKSPSYLMAFHRSLKMLVGRRA